MSNPNKNINKNNTIRKNKSALRTFVGVSAVCVALILSVLLYCSLLNDDASTDTSDASSYASELDNSSSYTSSVDEGSDIQVESSDADADTTVDSSSDVSDSEDTPAFDDETKPAPADWRLILVNPDSPLPEGYSVELEEIQNGHMVDKRIANDLRQMLEAARNDGVYPRITSAHRPVEDQIAVMQEYIDRYISEGYTQEAAEEEAKKWVALPGYSEHETGLAVDISTADWNKQIPEVIWEWLEQNSWKYGFILRYTERCKELTGMSVEPWHFRYVGKTAASEIYHSGVCLEEYLS